MRYRSPILKQAVEFRSSHKALNFTTLGSSWANATFSEIAGRPIKKTKIAANLIIFTMRSPFLRRWDRKSSADLFTEYITSNIHENECFHPIHGFICNFWKTILLFISIDELIIETNGKQGL